MLFSPLPRGADPQPGDGQALHKARPEGAPLAEAHERPAASARALPAKHAFYTRRLPSRGYQRPAVVRTARGNEKSKKTQKVHLSVQLNAIALAN